MVRHLLPILAAHLLYVFILPSRAGKAVAVLGVAVTLVLLVGPKLSRRFADRVEQELAGIDGFQTLVPLAFFALPLLSLAGRPTVAFWRLDGRALIVIAWLACLSWMLFRRRPDARLPGTGLCGARSSDRAASQMPHGRLSGLTLLFILWSALFWLILIWDVGLGRAVMLVSREERLLTSFGLWETRPASEHLFLVWLDRQSFEKHVAYTNHLHPILFFLYGCSKLAQLLTGLPPYVGRNVTPFAMAGFAVAAFTALVPRPLPAVHQGMTFHATLFVALGFVLSEWHFWYYPFWNFDTVFPVIASLTALVWASASPRVSDRNAVRVIASLGFFAAFGWVYTPVLILAVWCLFGRMRPTLATTLAVNRQLVRASLLAAAVGLLTYALPVLLVKIKGYDTASSSFLFRSGLDGDTKYFQDAVQAVLHPFPQARTLSGVIFPAYVPLLTTVAWAWRVGGLTRRRIGRQLIFLLAPYLFSLALFPQSVSIHPYLYDNLFLLPVVLVGSTWALHRRVQSRLRGGSLLAALLLAAILIMANFIAIAQSVIKVIPG
jgi:hypothetical protein